MEVAGQQSVTSRGRKNARQGMYLLDALRKTQENQGKLKLVVPQSHVSEHMHVRSEKKAYMIGTKSKQCCLIDQH